MPNYSFEGSQPAIAESAFVHPTAVLIGNVTVGEHCYVGPGASLRGDFGSIVMEDEANLQDNCVVHGSVGARTMIGARGHIGHGAVLHGCTVEEDVLVGINAVVMDDCRIGAGSIIGACSLVRKGVDCKPRSLLLGSPARVVRQLGESDLNRKREATQRYIELARRCHAGLREC